MRFSLNFVKEFIDFKTTPKELCELLTQAGIEVEHYERLGDDWVFDIEVTSNRYDWLSHIGIAREIAAVSGIQIKASPPRSHSVPAGIPKKIIVKDNNDCPLYIARIISDVNVCDSPPWLKECIEHCGIPSINNVVDITNYCMLKWGNPLHAFDSDKIEGDVYVRRAKKGEPFLGLDGKERRLTPENLVIADAKKVIALAGVIGAKNTEVEAGTKHILLEAAVFSPVTTRRSRRLTVETDSSYRFERRVCPQYVEVASREATDLIGTLAGGKFAGYTRAGKKPVHAEKKIMLSVDALEHYLGAVIPLSEVKKILKHLGFSLGASSKGKVGVGIPPFRLDIEQEVDLYEEVARVYGYDKIPSRLPSIENRIPIGLYDFKKSLRNFLISTGLGEIMTFGITSQELLDQLKEKNYIQLINPLRSQENVMRTTLLTGALAVLGHNLNQQAQELELFEVSDVYQKTAKGFSETPAVALIASGPKEKAYRLKAVVESLAGWLGVGSLAFEAESRIHFTNAVTIMLEKKEVGFLGKLDNAMKEAFALKEDMYFAQIDVAVLSRLKKEKKFVPFGRYPSAVRDISLALSDRERFGAVEKLIREKTEGYLGRIEVIDVYEGENLPRGHTGLTVRVHYQSHQKTLTSQEVDRTHESLREALSGRDTIILR